MILILTGVPGTGKDTIAAKLEQQGFIWLSLNKIVKRHELWDRKEKNCLVVNIKKLEKEIKKQTKKIKLSSEKKDILIEGHLACELKIPANLCIVLRTDPEVLRERLRKREYKKEKIEENILCEELDYCTQNAEKNLDCQVYEVRTDKKLKETLEDIEKILSNKGKKFKAGRIDWSSYLLKREKI